MLLCRCAVPEGTLVYFGALTQKGWVHRPSPLEKQCNDDPTCIENGLPQVLATAEANMQTILAALRATGYNGVIVIVNYYSPDYSNQFDTEVVVALNQAITAPAPAYGAVVADVSGNLSAPAPSHWAQSQMRIFRHFHN